MTALGRGFFRVYSSCRRFVIGWGACLGLIGALLIWSTSAPGQIFECIDANGKKEYAQKCPDNSVGQKQLKIETPTSSINQPPQKSIAEQEADFQRRQIEKREATDKEAKDKMDKMRAELNCNATKSQLSDLESGKPMSECHDHRCRYIDEDVDERAKRIAEKKNEVQNWCHR